MSRSRYSTRWDEDNCRPQCYGCNVMQQGKQFEFALKLDEEREGMALEIRQRSNETVKFSNPELIEKIDIYKEKSESLEKINAQ